MIAMQSESKLMTDALALAVAGKPFSLPEQIDWPLFCRLCSAHVVGALVCDGLQKAGCFGAVPEQQQKRLWAEYHHAIYRDSQLEHTRQQLSQKLEESKIPHIFLKGASLKYNYPVPALRTMCDLDVLVKVEDFPRLEEIALALEGKPGHSDGNHRNYTFPGGAMVEFHPNLLHQDTPVGTGINPGWQYARETGGAAMELTEEGFYLNTVCHLANHFVDAGVGVRYVLDVWVNRHLRKPEPNRKQVEAELRRFGLLDFARNIEALAEAWFGRGEMTPVLEELAEYILTSGLQGTSDRAMLNAVALSPGQSQTSALMKKAFYSREEMETRFPWCKGKPWLLPVAWIVRAVRAVCKRWRLILKWGKGTGQFSKEEVSQQAAQLKRFGIVPEKK